MKGNVNFLALYVKVGLPDYSRKPLGGVNKTSLDVSGS